MRQVIEVVVVAHELSWHPHEVPWEVFFCYGFMFAFFGVILASLARDM